MFCASATSCGVPRHLLEEIETGAARDGARLPAHHHIVGMLRAPSGGHFPQLALFVINKAARRPGQQCWHDIADTFAAARRGNDDAVLGTVVAEVVRAASAVRPAADIDAGAGLPAARQQTVPADLELGLEARGSVHAVMPDWPPAASGRDAHDREHAERSNRHQR